MLYRVWKTLQILIGPILTLWALGWLMSLLPPMWIDP